MYKRHRFLPEIIQYADWLYHRLNLGHRDIEDLLAERGITVSYESIRLWSSKFGLKYVRRLKTKHQGYGDAFFIDEVFVKIVPDKLRSYGVAHRELIPDTIHDISQYANSRVELSHQPTRVREQVMRRFKSKRQAQRFLAVHAAVYNPEFVIAMHSSMHVMIPLLFN